MLHRIFTTARSAWGEQVSASDDADSRRRAQNVRWISACLSILLIGLLGYSYRVDELAAIQAVLALTGLATVGSYMSARQGATDTAGRGLVLGGLACITVAAVARGEFGLLPFYYAVVLMTAGAVLRTPEVLACVASTMALLIGLWLGLDEPLAPGLRPGAFVVGALTVNGAAAVLAVLNASSVARALESAEQGATIAQRTEQALRESERYYRLIADHTSDLIALLDSGGRFIYASPSFAQSLGYAPVMLVGSFASEILHPDDRRIADGDADRARAQGWAQGTYRAHSRAGRLHWLDMQMSRVQEDGEEYLVVVARDITLRRDLEAQLQQAQKMDALGRLAGGVAHDFNNLLSVISGCAELAAAAIPRGDPARDDLDQVLDASGRAAVLTRQLLAFARRQTITPRVVAIGEVILGIAPLLRRLLGPDVRLVTRAAPELLPVHADPSQIEQVIMNMAINARDAMPGGGQFTIVASNRTVAGEAGQLGLCQGRYVCLELSDTGAGIDEELQRRIFEPFFTTKGPDRGTGLGLSTCYGIVAQSGGTITVSSAPGQGSTFTVLLPACAPEP